MTSSIVLLYYLMSLISIRYFLLRFPAKISPPTRKNKLVIVIILNLILQLLHSGGNIYHIVICFIFCCSKARLEFQAACLFL